MGGCGRGELAVFPEGHQDVGASVYLASVLICNMMWERAASSLLLSGPEWLCASIAAAFSAEGPCAFEFKNMPNACGTPDVVFEVKIVPAKDLPCPSLRSELWSGRYWCPPSACLAWSRHIALGVICGYRFVWTVNPTGIKHILFWSAM